MMINIANWTGFVAKCNSPTVIVESLEVITNSGSCSENTQTETLIIENFLYTDPICDQPLFSSFKNLKVIEIHNINAPKLKVCSNMFSHMNCQYLKLHFSSQTVEDCSGMFHQLRCQVADIDIQFPNATTCERMFYESNITKANLNIRFTNKLKTADNMFREWQTLTPSVIEHIVTYRATTDHIFLACAFESALVSKLADNNRKALLTNEEKQTETMKDMLTSTLPSIVSNSVESIVSDRIDSVLRQLSVTSNTTLSEINKINKTVDERIDTKIRTVNNNLSSTINEQSTTLKKDIQNIRSSLDSTKRQLDSKIDMNKQSVYAVAQLVQGITNLTDRIESLVENVDKRVHDLESKTPPEFKPKFSDEEAKQKVYEMVTTLWQTIADRPSTPTNKKFQQLVYDTFKDKYGWERIEFVKLRRLVISETQRYFNVQRNQYVPNPFD